MTGRIKIDIERCKGCGLCVAVCPKNCITISKHSNEKGFFYAKAKQVGCTGCANCALMCPENVIEVYRDDNIKSVEPKCKTPRELVKEK